MKKAIVLFAFGSCIALLAPGLLARRNPHVVGRDIAALLKPHKLYPITLVYSNSFHAARSDLYLR